MKRRPGVERRRRRLANEQGRIEYSGVSYLDQQKAEPGAKEKYQIALNLFNQQKGEKHFKDKYDEVKSKKGPLNGAMINLNGFPSSNQLINYYASMLEEGLRAVESKAITGGEGSGAPGIQKKIPKAGGGTKLVTEWNGDHDVFVNAQNNGVLDGMRKIYEAIQGIDSIVKQKGNKVIQKGSWDNIMARFNSSKFTGPMKNKLLNGNGSLAASNYTAFMNAIGSGFRQDLGRAMEDIMTQVVDNLGNNPNFLNYLESIIAKNLKGVSSSNSRALVSSTAIPGTIRTSVEIGSDQTPKGNPLRDTTITFDFGDGTSQTYGVSVKRYNFYRFQGEIALAVANLNFLNYKNIMFGLADSAKVPRISLYRAYVAARPSSGYYLAGEAIESIYKGRNLINPEDLRDNTDLMIINGWLMDVSTYMENSTGRVEMSGVPKGGNRWIPGGKAQAFIDAVHASKLNVYATIAQSSKLAAIGK